MVEWRIIDEFPDYEVSDEGQVRNISTQQMLGIFDNGNGVLQVVLTKNKKKWARAVHRLVANAFLDLPPVGYVPIFLDGDRTNLSASNLEWKPRWFAVKRTLQAKRVIPMDDRPIIMLKTEEIYPNALECAKAIGGLEELVLITAQNRHGATYMGSQFEFYYDYYE